LFDLEGGGGGGGEELADDAGTAGAGFEAAAGAGGVYLLYPVLLVLGEVNRSFSPCARPLRALGCSSFLSESASNLGRLKGMVRDVRYRLSATEKLKVLRRVSHRRHTATAAATHSRSSVVVCSRPSRSGLQLPEYGQLCTYS